MNFLMNTKVVTMPTAITGRNCHQGLCESEVFLSDKRSSEGTTSQSPVLKQCSKCGRYLTPDCFHNDKRRNDGKVYHCKQCRSRYFRKDYYPAHREKLIAQTIKNRKLREAR